MSWVNFNTNPENKHNDDCAIRAVSFAMNKSWEQTFLDLATEALAQHCMPSTNSAWGKYLHDNGFTQKPVEKYCENCYSLEDFCADHPKGLFVVALPNHVVSVLDGNYYDTWDSGSEHPLYYWEKENVKDGIQ